MDPSWIAVSTIGAFLVIGGAFAWWFHRKMFGDVRTTGRPIQIEAPTVLRLELGATDLHYQIGEVLIFHGQQYVVQDLVTQTVILQRRDLKHS